MILDNPSIDLGLVHKQNLCSILNEEGENG